LGSQATLHREPSVAQDSVFFNQASLHLTTPKIVHQVSAAAIGQSSRAKHSIKLPITEALVSSPMAVNSRIDFRGDTNLNQRSVAGASQSSDQMSRYMAQMARIASELEARPHTEVSKGGRQSAKRYANVYRLAEQANAWSSNRGEDFQALMVNTLSGPRLHGARPSQGRLKSSMGFSASHTRVNSTVAGSSAAITRPQSQVDAARTSRHTPDIFGRAPVAFGTSVAKRIQ